MQVETFSPLAELESNWEQIEPSPRDSGHLEMIVRRPAVDERELLTGGMLDPKFGLVGDIWSKLGHSPNPRRQVTLMNARVIALLASTPERRALAGDQLFVDLDLSTQNLPPGSRLQIGSAVVELSSIPHTGCEKFAARFGQDALAFVNAPERKEQHLRGVNARVVQAGSIHTGDTIEVIRRSAPPEA